MAGEVPPRGAGGGGSGKTPPPTTRIPLRNTRTGAWLRRFAKLWGFALFCILVVYIFRDVALPFLFAILVAYILAPVVDRISAFRLAGKTLPRGLAVIIVYINILAALGFFIGYFIPKLSGDFARLFREAPHLFSRLNTELVPRVGGWVDTYLGAGEEAEAELLPGPEENAPRGIVLEPLPGGRFKIDLEHMALEVLPAENGRYIIAPPHSEAEEAVTGGKWERSIKKWLTAHLQTTESESRRALEYGQKFVTAV
ncbi:MAG TPA: AI-2E family transporter, partial [Polyangia bacterium]|nr:AI-2E family transporter [Polyangia bacterium]